MKKIYTIVLLLFTINNYSCMDVTAKMSQDIKNSKLISWLLYNNQNYVPAPGNVRAEGVSETEITLTWEYSADAEGFKIENIEKTEDGNYKILYSILVDPDVKSQILKGLNVNTTYYYRISAYKNKIDSEYSPVVRGKTFTDITWETIYGSSQNDNANSIQQTKDGGYIVAGTLSQRLKPYASDAWIIKLDSNGDVLWDKTHGENLWDKAYLIQQTTDEGYIVAGDTNTNGNCMMWILKLDEKGDKVWDKTYGESKADTARSIQQNTDGGYIVAGNTTSYRDGYLDYNIYILKLDQDGTKTWEKTYGGTKDDTARSIQQTTDGGYIVTGGTMSFGYDFGVLWILKLDENGNKLWDRTYKGVSVAMSNSIQQTIDGGYIVAGWTGYPDFNGIVQDMNIYILKISETGNIQWEKTFGDISTGIAFSIQQTTDGGYIAAGSTMGSYGDIYILKLDENGNKTWDKTYGGSGFEEARSILQTTDGGYIVAGSTGTSYSDFWILKLNDIGEYKK